LGYITRHRLLGEVVLHRKKDIPNSLIYHRKRKVNVARKRRGVKIYSPPEILFARGVRREPAVLLFVSARKRKGVFLIFYKGGGRKDRAKYVRGGKVVFRKEKGI